MSDLFFSEYIEGSSNNKALELYNGTGVAIDLAAESYVVQMYFNGSTNPGLTINLQGMVANDDVFVLAQSSAVPEILAQADQTQGSGWFNGDDAIVLRKGSANGTILDVIGQIGVDPGSEWGSGLTSTQDNTLRRKTTVNAGDTNPSDGFDPSGEWEGFTQDTFNGLGSHTSDPTDPPPPEIIPIYEIQGASHISPFQGQSVITTGIVTAVDSNGFYLQDPQGDNNQTTSDGIFIFTRSLPTVSVGDEVQVAGTVSEFIPGGASTSNLSTTQISGNPTVTILSSGNPLPTATIIGASGRTPPTEIIDNDNFTVFEPNEDGIDFYESLEGMRVQVQDAVAVSPTNRFGEIFTLADQGINATGVSDRGTINISPDDFNPERIQIQIDRDLLPGFSPQVNVGTQLGDITGVVSYNFGNFEVVATEEFTPTPSNLEPEITTLVSTADQITIASFNVLNLDPNDNDGDQDIANGQFDAIATRIVNNLKAPDIIGLQEIQDNDGSLNTTVVDASDTYETLINAILEAGGPRYEFRDIPPEDDQSGGQPGGNIRVGFLFNLNRVDFVEGSLARIEDDNLADGDAFEDSRHSLSATFLFNGQGVTVVNNHLSSKGGSTPLFGQVQPPINGSIEQREAQAQVVNNYVDTILTQDQNANVVVLGDLNEFEFLSPLEILKGGANPVLTNLTETLPENERYSYIFEGNSQSLDHILVSDNLAVSAEYDSVHVNSEFVEQASDHDPLLSRFTLATPEGVFWGTTGADELVGTQADETFYGRAGDDIVAGGLGDDTIFGGDGNDVLRGDNNSRSAGGKIGGDDVIYGGEGSDRIGGKAGND
ncbi:MAG TPA: endonuclease, partial [Cyanobacteria bacterium UBA11370]|nr:endonuclease [Cyanobacteria bacterium UBA11370]